MPLNDATDRTEHKAASAGEWVAHAASEAYHATRNAIPVPEAYKDATIAAAGVAAGVTVAAVVARPTIGRMLAGSEPAIIKAEGVHIVPLTEENLPKAIQAGKEGFRYGWPFLNPAKDFKASLDPAEQAKRMGAMDKTIERNARYWLAMDNKGNVLGTTGLYETGKDSGEAAWMGWMSVRSEYRGQGIGKKLVDFSVDQARADGKQYLRLYTSTYKGEAAAQTLYDKEGIGIVSREPHPIPRTVQRLFGQKEPLEILVRERKLGS